MHVRHDIVAATFLLLLSNLESFIGHGQVRSHLIECLIGDLRDAELFLGLSQPEPKLSVKLAPVLLTIIIIIKLTCLHVEYRVRAENSFSISLDA